MSNINIDAEQLASLVSAMWIKQAAFEHVAFAVMANALSQISPDASERLKQGMIDTGFDVKLSGPMDVEEITKLREEHTRVLRDLLDQVTSRENDIRKQRAGRR